MFKKLFLLLLCISLQPLNCFDTSEFLSIKQQALDGDKNYNLALEEIENFAKSLTDSKADKVELIKLINKHELFLKCL